MKTMVRQILFVLCICCLSGICSFPATAQTLPETEVVAFYSDGESGLWENYDAGKIAPVPAPPAPAENQGKQAKKVACAQPLENLARDAATQRASALDARRQGALRGKFIYVNPGHGFTNYNGVWKTQRGNLYEMVEDHANSDQVCHFFLDYLRNAGATVVPLRDVGPGNGLYIIDNDDPGCVVFGTWYESSGPVFWGDEQDSVHYVYTPAGARETAVARWTPNIKTAGYYPVFVWYTDGPNRTTQATYRVVHHGGTSCVTLDQYRVGKGWVWLGNYYFASGSNGYVELSNKGDAGKVVIADAVRFGSGIHAESGYAWSDMCAHEYMVFSKAPEAVTSVSDVWCRPRMAAYMNNAEASQACYISFHSNANNGVSRGALVLKNSQSNEGGPVPHCDAFNSAIIHQLEDDLKHFWGLPSRNYQVYTSAYGELTLNNIGGEMTATILEVAFHDNADDTNLLNTAGFRRDTARAVLQGIVDYFADTHQNAPKVYPPDAPRKVSAVISGPGQVTVAWEAPPYGGYGAHQATGYVVCKSVDGYAWDQGVDVGNVLSYNYAGLAAGEECYFRVVAYNDGGVSFASETMGVRMTPQGVAPQVLVVSAFSRLDRQLTPLDYDACNGWSRRMRPWLINSFNYVAVHGKALAAAGYYFESSNSEKVADATIALDRYRAVDWILGRESDSGDTLSAGEQTILAQYLGRGGRLLVSGDNLGWDLELCPTASLQDKQFLHQVLQVACSNNDGSQTNVARGVAGTLFADLGELSFAKDFAANICDTQDPDVFTGLGDGAQTALVYGDTGQPAAVQYADAVKRLVVLGFPFETIHDDGVRQKVMTAIMGFLLKH